METRPNPWDNPGSKAYMKDKDIKVVTAVARALSILEAFDDAQPELGITEISN
jgi:hypothetical protein